MAAEYVRRHFAAAGLEPVGESFFHDVADDLAPNVVAQRRGTGRGYVLFTAHYDHLAPRADAAEGEDAIYNGADDNASGVAAILELADAFAALDPPPAATMVLVAFTAEEIGLRGSKHFAAHPPFPLGEVRAVINLDMISRGDENRIFCEGAGRFPLLAAAVGRANEVVGLEVRHDEHPEWSGASDHAPFLEKGVPALYFGVEDHEDYHRVTDHADKVLPRLIERVARLVFLTGLELSGPGVG